MKRKIVIAAGGTGGHLFPAQIFAQQLKDQGIEILFVSKGLSSNPFFDSQTFNFKDVDSATPSLSRLVKSLWHLSKGVFSSLRILRKFKPTMLIGFGSFYSFPALLAGILLRIPFVLHEQNIMPGKVNKLLAPLAKKVLVSFDKTKEFLKGDLCKVNYPIRNGKKQNFYDNRFSKDSRVVLVMGGSQGSSSLNNVLQEIFEKLTVQGLRFQVIHITGYKENFHKIQKTYDDLGIFAIVKPFEEDVEAAFSCADFIIGRAGAGALFDLIRFEKPAILIPYPFAGNHQELNARFFVEDVGGGCWLPERESLEEPLMDCIKMMMSVDLKQAYVNQICSFKREMNNIEFSDLIQELFV